MARSAEVYENLLVQSIMHDQSVRRAQVGKELEHSIVQIQEEGLCLAFEMAGMESRLGRQSRAKLSALFRARATRMPM